jgi:hypothetical protein
MPKAAVATKKNKRILSADEIRLAESLGKAMVEQVNLRSATDICRRLVSDLTQQVYKLPRLRALVVWAEADELRAKGLRK